MWNCAILIWYIAYYIYGILYTLHIYNIHMNIIFYIIWYTICIVDSFFNLLQYHTSVCKKHYQRWAKSRQTEESLTGWVPGKRSSVPCYATQKEALKAYLQVMRRNKEEREQAEKRKEQHRTQNEEGVWVPVKLEDFTVWIFSVAFFFLARMPCWPLIHGAWKGFFTKIVAPPNFCVVANSLWNRKQHLEQLLLDLRARTLSSPQRRQATWRGDGVHKTDLKKVIQNSSFGSCTNLQMGGPPKIMVPENPSNPWHLFIGFSIINHPFWRKNPLFLETSKSPFFLDRWGFTDEIPWQFVYALCHKNPVTWSDINTGDEFTNKLVNFEVGERLPSLKLT